MVHELFLCGTVLAFCETTVRFHSQSLRRISASREGLGASHRTRRVRHGIAAGALIVLTMAMGGCGFTSGASAGPPANVSVTVSPLSVSVSLGQTVQFAAMVTGAPSNAVNWSVNQIAGGNSTLGTISSSGLYTAPQALPANPKITVTATAQAAPQASGSATVQIQSGITVSIAPNSANVLPEGSVSFTATVAGAGNASTGVNWSVSGAAGSSAGLGTISASGANAAVYTAPAFPPPQGFASIVAASTADPSKTATATVTISCAAANSISPASASVAVGTPQVFTAYLCVAPGTAAAWDVNGISGGNSSVGTIASTGANTATYTAPAAVPSPSSVVVDATAGTQSASATIAIVGNSQVTVTVSPPSATLIAGQSTNFTATVSGTANPGVTWIVNGIPDGNTAVGQVCAAGSNPCTAPSGSEDAVEYLAPQAPPQPSNVTLTAISQASPSATGSAQITIAVPAQPGISVAPFYAFVGPTQQVAFTANVTGEANTGVTWQISSAVPGAGCTGASCGSIDNAGNYTAPALAPSPNAILVTAVSVANPSLTATATVAVTSGPTIETVLPSSVIAGAQQSFLLAVKGLNFIPTTSSGTSQMIINNQPRPTNCPTPNLCTITLQSSDVAAAGTLSIEIQNPGNPPSLSNPVSLVILPASQPPSAVALTGAAPTAAGKDIIVAEPTTAGATTSPVNIEFVGLASPDGSTCTIQASAISVVRPSSGTVAVNICVQGNFLDPTFTYSFSSPATGGDIGITTASMGSLFPNLIELTLTISNQTATGLRTLFVKTPNGDIATATGVIEVQ